MLIRRRRSSRSAQRGVFATKRRQTKPKERNIWSGDEYSRIHTTRSGEWPTKRGRPRASLRPATFFDRGTDRNGDVRMRLSRHIRPPSVKLNAENGEGTSAIRSADVMTLCISTLHNAAEYVRPGFSMEIGTKGWNRCMKYYRSALAAFVTNSGLTVATLGSQTADRLNTSNLQPLTFHYHIRWILFFISISFVNYFLQKKTLFSQSKQELTIQLKKKNFIRSWKQHRRPNLLWQPYITSNSIL